MTFMEFSTARRIIFGVGQLERLSAELPGRGKRLLLVHGRSSDAIPRVRDLLLTLDSQVTEFEVHGEPTVDLIREGVRAARGSELVVSVGGGSALDTGKAIAALLPNPGDVLDYLEVIGKGQPLVNASLPFIAIPTTAGTGSEVTRNAVLESAEHNVKVSLRNTSMLPWLALVDPQLTYDLPPHITASCGLDTLTQLVEPFVSSKATVLTDGICREGMQQVARSLETAYRDGTDRAARKGMSLASLFGGIALTNAALGAVHGFAGPLGGMLHAPHGALCARLLPLVMQANIEALESREPEHPALERYIEVAQILTGDRNAAARDGVSWTSQLVNALQIPRLSQYGLSEAQFPDAVQKTMKASSFKGNPIALTENELWGILEQAL